MTLRLDNCDAAFFGTGVRDNDAGSSLLISLDNDRILRLSQDLDARVRDGSMV
jgi:hypothetical protein